MTPSKSKPKQKHLGRGLESLMSPIMNIEEPLNPEQKEGIQHNFNIDKELKDLTLELNLTDIEPNPYQPRKQWDDEPLKQLAESIKENGIIQPVIVRRSGDKYQIVAGERRYRAAGLAGLEKLPVMVRKTDDQQMLALAIVENIHRSDLNPVEKAKAYKQYIDTFNFTQEQAAKHLGQDRSVLANYIRLLSLPIEIKEMLSDGTLSMGHARAILALPTDDLKRRLANRAMAGRLSVREVERLVRLALSKREETPQPAKDDKPVYIKDLEERIRSRLAARVNIKARKNGQRGKIIIEFYSLDEFDSIAEKLGVSSDHV